MSRTVVLTHATMSDSMEFPEVSHVQLVVDPQVREAIATWVSSVGPG